MRGKEWAKTHRDGLLSLGMAAALAACVLLRFDLYYDLNDDVLIKDILSGVYTGTPEGRTMQLLYPLGLLLSLCYRFLAVPVFGGFLALCQFGCIWAVGYRTVRLCKGVWEKVLVLAAEGLFFAAAYGWHLVCLQYTVTAGMLCAAALFWMLTGKSEERFQTDMLPALFLYAVGFCLRSEMGLLLLPLTAVAGLCRWGQEEKPFLRACVIRYAGTFAALLGCLGLCLALDALAYSSAEWRAFRQFFDARTELYDYQRDFVEQYEENEAIYSELGVSRIEQEILSNYNFGADDALDAERMAQLAGAASGRAKGETSFAGRLKEALYVLVRQQWLGAGDRLLSLPFLLAGALVFALGLLKGRRQLLWQAVLSGGCAAALWLFLLLRQRAPERVTHPLYLAQTLLFLGLLLRERGREAVGKKLACAASALIVCAAAVLSLAGLPVAVSELAAEAGRREAVNRENEAISAYCAAHPDRLFLEDVYSTVDYSETVWVDRKKPGNRDLLGGWLVKSPLTQEKLAAFGFSSMGEAVRAGGPVTLLAEMGSDFGWLEDYFAECGYAAQVVRVGEIGEKTALYQVIPEGAPGTQTQLVSP